MIPVASRREPKLTPGRPDSVALGSNDPFFVDDTALTLLLARCRSERLDGLDAADDRM